MGWKAIRPGKPIGKTIPVRFILRLFKKRIIRLVVPELGECWEYPTSKDKYGYCAVRIHGKTRWVHRVSYRFFKGRLPKDREVHHICHNPSCWRPDHLGTSTRSINANKGKGTI